MASARSAAEPNSRIEWATKQVSWLNCLVMRAKHGACREGESRVSERCECKAPVGRGGGEEGGGEGESRVSERCECAEARRLSGGGVASERAVRVQAVRFESARSFVCVGFVVLRLYGLCAGAQGAVRICAASVVSG